MLASFGFGSKWHSKNQLVDDLVSIVYTLIKSRKLQGFSSCSDQLFLSKMSSFESISASFSESDCKDSTSRRNIKFFFKNFSLIFPSRKCGANIG